MVLTAINYFAGTLLASDLLKQPARGCNGCEGCESSVGYELEMIQNSILCGM
jgi:hypothetical protein